MMHSAFFVVICLLVYVCVSQSPNALGPVVGIIPQPCTIFGIDECELSHGNASDVLHASYVKWVEMSGGQTIPLFSNLSRAELTDLLPKLNGVLITGGNAPSQPTTDYERFIKDVMDLLRTFAQQNKPHSIPLWGTCDGFQNMLTAVAKTGESVMGQFDSDGVNLKIEFTENIYNNSVIFASLDNEDSLYYDYNRLIVNLMSANAISRNDHHKGITPEVFASDAYVQGNFSNLGRSVDKNGRPFVTLFESHRELGLNWFGSQFHPEKVMFDASDTVNRSYNAVLANTFFADFFVNQCRVANENVMSNDEFGRRAIYNYMPTVEVNPWYLFYST